MGVSWGGSLSPFILRHSYAILILFKIMIIFGNTSTDFVLIAVENYHNFEQNKDRAT